MRLCECGCGLPTEQAKRNIPERGLAKGDYSRFRAGHYSRTAEFRALASAIDPNKTRHIGQSNGNWRGGRSVDAAGYVIIRVGVNSTRREHRLVAEEMLGRALRPGEVVHHRNGNRADNRPANLKVLPSQSEHMRGHMTPEEARQRGRNGGWAKRAALKAVEAAAEVAAS